jgi:SAM-dependent methyltransferase
LLLSLPEWVMIRALVQDLVMVPVHLTEGLAVRYGFFRTLYRLIAPVYGPPRPLLYFGEDLFLAGVDPGDRVLELGSGTGYLTRKLREKTGDCVGLEPERAMVTIAAGRGGGARYVTGGMEHIPFKPGSFTKCVSLGSLHCADPDAVAGEVWQVLADGGEFLLLAEARVIPLLAPASAPIRIRHALECRGFEVVEEKGVGRLYVWLRAVKPLARDLEV